MAGVASSASTSPSTWIRVASPPIELFTDGGEKTARAVLDRFAALHRVFDQSNIASPPAPLRVFVFSSEEEYRKYRMDSNAAAFYQSDDGRDLMVLHQGTAFERIASHEYLHLVIRHASAPLPRWLEEGVAEFYSTLSINGTKMHIGDAIQAHLSLLAVKPWFSAEDLALVNRADDPVFYAEAWALVHMLNLAPAWRTGMPRFVQLLNQGQEQEKAFTAAFGRTMEDALKALRPYLRNPKGLTFPAPPMDVVTTYQVTPLAPVDATVALADLALATRHTDRARTLFLLAAKENPDSPQASAGLAELALAENRKDDAQRELEQAIARGSRDAAAYFQLAILKNDDTLLEKTVVIDPTFAEAQFLLGVRATDKGSFAIAIDHLRHAIDMQPKRFTYWHALGYAQAKSGNRQGAAESARRAAVLASTPQEEQMAASLTQLASELPLLHEKKSEVTTPPSWQNPKGDARAEGTLIQIDCDSSPVRLVLSAQAPARTIELRVKDPSGVELINAEGVSTSLACGEQARPVAVDYIAATREITRIEFKGAIIKP